MIVVIFCDFVCAQFLAHLKVQLTMEFSLSVLIKISTSQGDESLLAS